MIFGGWMAQSINKQILRHKNAKEKRSSQQVITFRQAMCVVKEVKQQQKNNPRKENMEGNGAKLIVERS